MVTDNARSAEGTLDVDDGESSDYEQGAYVHRKFSFDPSKATLVSEDIGTTGKKTEESLKTMANVRVEKVVMIGAPSSWAEKIEALVMEDGAKEAKKVALSWHSADGKKAAWAVVRDPGVAIGRDWKIDFRDLQLVREVVNRTSIQRSSALLSQLDF